MDNLSQLVTYTRAAELMNVSQPTVTNWVRQGLLPLVEVAGRKYVRADLLPRVRRVTHKTVFLEYPEGFDEPEVLENAKEQGYVRG